MFSIFRLYIKVFSQSPRFLFYPCTSLPSPVSTVICSSSLHHFCSYPFTCLPSLVYTVYFPSVSTFLVLSMHTFSIYIFHNNMLIQSPPFLFLSIHASSIFSLHSKLLFVLNILGYILPCICPLPFPQYCSFNRHLLSLFFLFPSCNFDLPEMNGRVSTYTWASFFSSSCRRPVQNITVRSFFVF